jgi:aminoglycoside 2''-phosphotransferase
MNPPARSVDPPHRTGTASPLIAARVPHLAPALITARHEGDDEDVIEVNHEWVFRFPKRAECEAPLRRELALLPHVGASLPVPVPDYRLVGQPGPDHPRVFAGYRRLNGIPASDRRLGLVDALALAPPLGATLSAIHDFPAGEAARLGGPRRGDEAASGLGGAIDRLDRVRGVLGPKLHELCRVFLKELAHAGRGRHAPTGLIHGNFKYENIIISHNNSKVEGVVRWSDCGLGDPAYDFGHLWVWQGEPMVREVLRDYRGHVDPGFSCRIRSYGVGQAIEEIRRGLEEGAEGRQQIGLGALRRSFLIP